jgi:hypothetical protein
MRVLLCGLAGGFLMACSGPAVAQQGPAAAVKAPAVIELYTSQGCSACPPADALLGRYAARKDVVALTLPVDYWDYLGWRDTLATPAFSRRQRAYAKARGDGMVYTPQAVVNGVAHVNGSSAAEIDLALERTAGQLSPRRIPLAAWIDNGALRIQTGEAPAAGLEGTIWVATVEKQIAIPVKHGENRGKTLTYHNVVRQLTPVGMWSAKGGAVQLERSAVLTHAEQRCAVLLQQGTGGPIVAAAWAGTP